MLDCLTARRPHAEPLRLPDRRVAAGATTSDLDEVGRLLFDRGIYVTLAAYPLVPRNEVGIRVQVTAANGDAEVDRLILALTDLADRGLLQPRYHFEERAA